MTYGFVYFLTNPSIPGAVKIGMTMKHPRERMAELSSSTSCPQPFEMLAFFDSHNPGRAEAEIHKALAQYRVNDRREFFAVPMEALQDQMRQWGDNIEGCYVNKHLDLLVDEEMAGL